MEQSAVVSVRDGATELYVLGWPVAEGEVLHGLCLVVMLRQGGALIAVPPGLVSIGALQGAEPVDGITIGLHTSLVIPALILQADGAQVVGKIWMLWCWMFQKGSWLSSRLMGHLEYKKTPSWVLQRILPFSQIPWSFCDQFENGWRLLLKEGATSHSTLRNSRVGLLRQGQRHSRRQRPQRRQSAILLQAKQQSRSRPSAAFCLLCPSS